MSACTPVFLHVDLDAFFASVEQLDHPEWRGKPVIVGGKPGDRRSVVSTASYEARRYGVHSAMAVAEAVRLCPQGIYVHPRMQRYHEKSEEVMAIFRNYSPDVQQMSVDEAFVDLTGTERLFGAVEETAKRIKAEVREKTGLTVSVGMAQTRYLAKIASGLQKPDGLCVVPPGSETDFMLSLPLTKLWGAGAKTQSKLRAAGIFTCRDVYNRSLAILQSLFGRAGGSFLYNAVRGGEADTFAKEAKSHSVSSESTYPYDLVTRDAIDTALLELSYTVVFRLLRERLRSSDVSLKIRYDDFTTVSIQEASERDIASVDDMFERAKKLFYRKYEPSRGVRLLGLAAQHVEDSSKPRQAELFDFGDEKRRRLESAILAAKQKNPAIKITKARLLETGGERRVRGTERNADESAPNATTAREQPAPPQQSPRSPRSYLIAFALLALSAFFAPAALHAESETERTADGAGSIVFDTSALPLLRGDEPTTLFANNVAGKSVEFLAQGYWQSALTGTASYSFGFGSSPAFSAPAPVFMQKVDLSLWFLLDKHWYFEADFADEFERNTVAAGYTGDGLVKEARIANRGIAFPSLYSIDDLGRGIGGGSALSSENQAPGVSLQLGGKTWRADAAVRYDLLSAQEKSWYGKNSVTKTTIALSDWYTGSQYVLPSADAVKAVRAVYVESANGDARDTSGRRYKKLIESQYLLSASDYSVYLSRDAGAARTSSGALPAVAFAFSSALPDTSAFIADTAEAFAAGGVDLAPYLYTLTGAIDGEAVLYVQHPAGFSPFAAAYRYDAGLSDASADAAIVSASTEVASRVYLAALSDDELFFTTTDFFYDNHSYVTVYTEALAESPLTDARARFPFAAADAGVYLGYSQQSDLALSVRNYSAVSRFDIGTKAVPGTIRVYKNGILDSGARYDEESGTLTLSTAVSESDHIYATWYEDSEDADTGALAAAAGILWQLTPRVTMDVSASTRWTYAGGREAATSDYSVPATATLASRVAYEGEHLFFSNTVAASVENANTTDLYRVLGMDDAESDWVYMTKDAAVDVPSGFTPALNVASADAASTSPPLLLPENNGSTSAASGTSDSSLPGGYAVPVRWDFSSVSAVTDATPAWAATALYLAGSGSALAASSRVTFYLRAATPAAVKVYLQLGVAADDDFAAEDRELIPTWLISDGASAGVISAFEPLQSGWQRVTVALTDVDRSRLVSAHDARIIVTSADGTPTTGTLYAGSYRTDGVCFSVTADSAIAVSQRQETDSALSTSRVEKLNTGTNYVQRFDWRTSDAEAVSAKNGFTITGSRYFEAISLADYGELSLYFKLELPEASALSATLAAQTALTTAAEAAFTLTLSRPTAHGGDETALSVALSPDTLLSVADGNWHELTVALDARTLAIDGTRVISVGGVTVKRSVLPTHLSFALATAYADASADDEASGVYFKSGSLSLDEPSLSDAALSVVVQDLARAGWQQDGAVLTTSAGSAIVSDILLSTEGEASAALQTEGDARETAFSTSAAAGATVLGVRLSAEAAHASDTNAPLATGSHRVQSEAPLWDSLSFIESYSYSAREESLAKANSAAVDLSSHGVPLKLSATTAASSDARAQTQRAATGARFAKGMFSFALDAGAEQRLTPARADVTLLATDSYAQGWRDATALAFSTGSREASQRNVALTAEGAVQLPLLRFKPTVRFSNDGAYKTSAATLFSDNEVLSFALPFAVSRQQFEVSWTKKAGGLSYTTKGGSYRRDASELFSANVEKDWYYRALPIYDLISDELSHTLLEESALTASSAESLYYEGSYNASWKRAVFGTSRDIMLPTTMSVTFSRSIRTASSVSDSYQLKATIGYTALNVFGSAGTLPLARWFQQDEYSASASATLKIPRAGGSVSMLYTTYVQAAFFVSKANMFKTGIEASFETVEDWSGKLTAVWKRDSTFSPILSLLDLFSRQSPNANPKLTRTDSVNLSATSAQNAKASSTSSVVRSYAAEIKHQLDLAISDSVTVNTAVGGGYASTWGSLITLSAMARLGATLRF